MALDDRDILFELQILNDLNLIRAYGPGEYQKAAKSIFDSPRYKQIDINKIATSLLSLLENEHVEIGYDINWYNGLSLDGKYNILKEGMVKITQYGRTMLDFNSFGQNIYLKLTNAFKGELEDARKIQYAGLITILGMFVSIFALIVNITNTNVKSSIPITQAVTKTGTFEAGFYSRLGPLEKLAILRGIDFLVIAIILLLFVASLYLLFGKKRT